MVVNKGMQVGGVYTSATLPAQFFVEGTVPSHGPRDTAITLQYLYISSLGVPTAAASDEVAVTVTPLITDFTINPGRVIFRNRRQMNGLLGLVAAGPGVGFSATVTRTAAAGDVTFIQNLQGVDNGANGAAAGWVFTAASRLPNMNTVLVGRATFPILDRINPPGQPDYDAQVARPVNNQDTQQITAADSPRSGFPVVRGSSAAAVLTNIDVTTRYRMYLVWRFPRFRQ